MPIGEDEFDSRDGISQVGSVGSNNDGPQTTATLSKAELRRNNKPIMEKRRRARINHCLNELKTLILDALKKDPARHTKLEKADILEMTVKHLQNLSRQQHAQHPISPLKTIFPDVTVLHKYKSGFSECADEINRFVSSMDDVDANVKNRLVSHLSNCINNLQQASNFSQFTNAFNSTSSSVNSLNTLQNSRVLNSLNPTNPLKYARSFNNEDVNNNGYNNLLNQNRVQLSNGIQLIPSRLPSGEIALLVPNSHNVPFLPSSVKLEAQSLLQNVITIPDSSSHKNDQDFHQGLQRVENNRNIPGRLDRTERIDCESNELGSINEIRRQEVVRPSNIPTRHNSCSPVMRVASQPDPASSPASTTSLGDDGGLSRQKLTGSLFSYQSRECRGTTSQQPQISSSTPEANANKHRRIDDGLDLRSFRQYSNVSNGSNAYSNASPSSNPISLAHSVIVDPMPRPTYQINPRKRAFIKTEIIDVDNPEHFTHEVVSSTDSPRQYTASPESLKTRSDSHSRYSLDSANCSGSSASDASTSGSNDSMWRPW